MSTRAGLSASGFVVGQSANDATSDGRPNPRVSHPPGIPPAAHAGHRELDLAMLALFGLPQLPRAMQAYDDAYPLADGWEDRLGVHQLYPLLVHAAMFGGGYGARAGETARRYG